MKQPPGLQQRGDGPLGVPDPHVEHPQIVQGDPLPSGLAQGAANRTHLLEPRPRGSVVPQVGVDQSDVVGGNSPSHPVLHGAGGAGRLLEMPHRVGQLSLVPGHQSEGIVGTPEFLLQVQCVLDGQRSLLVAVRLFILALPVGSEPQQRQRLCLDDGVVLCSRLHQRGEQYRPRLIELSLAVVLPC